MQRWVDMRIARVIGPLEIEFHGPGITPSAPSSTCRIRLLRDEPVTPIKRKL